jgi:ATP-dependent RNA helicase RhlE
VDILGATQGRLNDLNGHRLCDLSYISMFVLDEADRMLDMGLFRCKKGNRPIAAEASTLLFSATMPKEITALASSILRNPFRCW